MHCVEMQLNLAVKMTANKALKVKCACCSQHSGYFENITEHFFSAHYFPSNLFPVSRNECKVGMLLQIYRVASFQILIYHS
jgi:hypothetical protein